MIESSFLTPCACDYSLKGLVAYGHSLALQLGFYLNTCICMEKGRTYFEEDVAFM